jgi:aspartate aminotransferase-like enzyme
VEFSRNILIKITKKHRKENIMKKPPMIMTPGPTFINEAVRKAMAKEITNPDLDLNFFDFYKETCHKFKEIFHTANDVIILGGEGILGLEAACASIIEPGDKVLCIDNGIFGHGFGDFAKLYGAEVTYFDSDKRKGICIDSLNTFLESNNDFKLATLVHCETPSGITNPVDKICPLLKSYGILTVVDSVSALGGEELLVDEWKMDIVIAGSQKCLSSAPGLTIMSISPSAWLSMENRRVPVASFYCNLNIWKSYYENKSFPYTQSISNIYGLRESLDQMINDKKILERHKKIASATRESLKTSGLYLYAENSFSNTVTTVIVPKKVKFKDIFNLMIEDHNIMIAGAFDFLEGKVFRIGHMGENCREDKVFNTLKALDDVLRKLEVPLRKKIHKEFADLIV